LITDMVIENKSFDEKIRDAFADFEARPPAHAWYGISLGIAQYVPRHTAPLVYKVAAGLAILLVSSLSFWFLTSQPYGEVPGLASENTVLPTGSLAPELALAEVLTSTAPVVVLAETPGSTSSTAEKVKITAPVNFSSPASLLAFLPEKQPSLQKPALDYHQEILPQEQQPSLLAFESRGIDFSFLTLGVHIAPQYSFRHLAKPSEIDNGGIPFENLESALFSFNIGVSAKASLRPWLSLHTGVSYSTMGQFVNDIVAFSHPFNLPLFELDRNSNFGHPQTIVTSQGNIRLSEPSLFFADVESYRVITNKQYFADGDPKNLSVRDFGLSQYFSFLEIPLVAHVRVLEMQRAELHVKAGGSMNYLLGNEVFLGRRTMSKPIGETYGLRKFNFSALGGFVLNVPLNKSLNLTIEPTAQMFVMPLVRDQLMIGRALPFQYSVFTGITYGF